MLSVLFLLVLLLFLLLGLYKEFGLWDKDFIVREIVNKREWNGIVEYEVKWDDIIVIDNIIY